jgi:H+/Na+-translocating ferredoxin:NAD+ oxidoreductase subunit B
MSISFLIALLLVIIITVVIGYLSSNKDTNVLHQTHHQVIESIEELLPQTQCGDCGFNGCRPYAEAIANHTADINRCLPGGNETVKVLSSKIGLDIKPLYKNTDKYAVPRLALIEEEHCIGCVKCIAACPVDAIIGAPKQMHSVIDAYCTGCELCIAPCPVDCITIVSAH